MLKLPDIQTLQQCSLLTTLAFGFVFALVWRGRRSETYLLDWAASSLVYGVALIGFEFGQGRPLLMALLLGLLAVSNVLLLAGVRRFDGLAPFHPWMVVPVLAAILGYGLPAAAVALHWLPPGSAALRVGESIGLCVAVALLGSALIWGNRSAATDGRRFAGAALLGYIPAYLLGAAGALGFLPGSHLLPMLPFLADQLLLGVLNLGLLAMPARRAQAQLREAALRDPLTGAWNRSGLAAQQARLLAPGAAVIAIDVDHFKAINDLHGHAAGDEVLVTIAREAGRCASSLGGEIARIGGDEFVVVLPPASRGGAFFAERMRAILPGAVGSGPRWTVSLGVTAVAQGEDSFAPALKRADDRLYRAKALGRDRVAA